MCTTCLTRRFTKRSAYIDGVYFMHYKLFHKAEPYNDGVYSMPYSVFHKAESLYWWCVLHALQSVSQSGTLVLMVCTTCIANFHKPEPCNYGVNYMPYRVFYKAKPLYWWCVLHALQGVSKSGALVMMVCIACLTRCFTKRSPCIYDVCFIPYRVFHKAQLQTCEARWELNVAMLCLVSI
jgi:hypothetical protein